MDTTASLITHGVPDVPLPLRKLSREDFAPFARAYSLRRQRATGKLPAPTTLRTKVMHLVSVANQSGCGSMEFLGTLLDDREATEAALDRLASRMTTGAMRGAVFALEDFALYAKSQGWAKHPTLRATDLPPRNPQKAITVHTAAEIDLLLSAARGKGLRWWAFLTFLADTGRRVGEVLSLQWDWLRLAESPPYFQLPVQKNGRPQYLPLGTRLREEVFTPDHVAVLQSREHDNFTRDPSAHPFPWTYPSVRSLMISHCQTVGVTHRGLHVLRHTRATQWLASGVPLNAVSKLLGHSNVAITARTYDWTDALSFAHYLD